MNFEQIKKLFNLSCFERYVSKSYNNAIINNKFDTHSQRCRIWEKCLIFSIEYSPKCDYEFPITIKQNVNSITNLDEYHYRQNIDLKKIILKILCINYIISH